MTSIALCLSREDAAKSGADEVFLWDGTPGDSWSSPFSWCNSVHAVRSSSGRAGSAVSERVWTSLRMEVSEK